MNLLLILVACMIPFIWYFWREHKLNTPALQWPALKTVLGLQYEANPPRLRGPRRTDGSEN